MRVTNSIAKTFHILNWTVHNWKKNPIFTYKLNDWMTYVEAELDLKKPWVE